MTVGAETGSPTASHSLHVGVSPGAIVRVLASAAIVVVVSGLVAHVLIRGHSDDTVQALMRPFLLDEELTVMAWFSSVLLLVVGIALAWVALARRGVAEPSETRRWWVLSGVFAVMSLDEAIVLHEMSGRVLARLLDQPTDRPLWVIPAGVAVLVVGAYVLPLFRTQPGHLRRLWLVALVTYAGGATVLEVASRPVSEPASRAGFTYIAMVATEESAEVAGALLFLYAVLRFAGEIAPSTTVDLEPHPPR